MAKRRGRGEGSISQRSDGRWQGRVDMGRGPNGKRQRKIVYGATRKDVASELNRLLGRAESGELLVTCTPSVTTWLNDWYRTHQDTWRPATRRTYRIAIDEWIAPHLGTVRLEKLKPVAIQRWVNQQTRAGASAHVVLAHVVLRSALKWAMALRVLTFNPAALVRVPRPTPRRPAPLTADQARQLVTAAGNHRLGGLILVSLTMGLRIGEACGLTWADVDLTAKTVKIRQQVQQVGAALDVAPLKTAASRRTLALPTLVVEILKTRRTRQREERLKAGHRWHQEHDLVFTTVTGGMLNPSTVRKALRGLLTGAGLPAVRFHTLRHTAATLLLADGAPLFDVSRILGHSQITTTADTYGHLVDDMTAGAAARMDVLLAAKKA